MNDKLYDLLMLENYEGIYEGSIKEDGDNWKYHAEWYFNELATFAEFYEIPFEDKVTDENIRKLRQEIKDFLLESITVVDVRKLGEEIAYELKDEIIAETSENIVDEDRIDLKCDTAWAEQIDGVFTHAYDKVKELGCKIRNYNGEIE